jgi:ankyrin repeat protein
MKKPVKAKQDVKVNGYTTLHGYTPLHWAVWDNCLKKVEKLISDGADLNAQGEHCQTPLHLAAKKGWQDVVRFLVKEGADVNPKDQDGWTPLHEAAFNGSQEIIKLLVDSGADLYAKTNEQKTPLQVANNTCKSLLKKIQEELQKTGLPPPPDENKRSAFVQEALNNLHAVIGQLQAARDEAEWVERLVLKSLLDQAEQLGKKVGDLLAAQQAEKRGLRL